MTKISDERLEELREKLKPDCCFLMYGECSTLSCLKRDAGGIRAAMPIELVGCETLHMDIALRELRAYRKEGWQPIETAPMDGKFLVWADHGLPWPASASDGVIRSNAHGSVNNPKDRYSLTATHWMPIPAAPEPQDTENGNVE